MEQEQWLPIIGYENCYEISSLGRVRSLDRLTKHAKRGFSKVKGRLIKTAKRGNYLGGTLYEGGRKKSYDVHRLVAEHFIPNPENKRTVNHKNGIPTDNRMGNLEWMSDSENQKHSIALGLRADRGEDHVNSKLTADQILEIRKIYNKKAGFTYKKLGEMYNMHPDYIGLVIKRKRWAYI